MKKFVIERELPGAGNLTEEELQQIARTSCAAVASLGKQYHWIQTFVTGDKLYCVHVAPDEETVRRHAEAGGFPVTSISRVSAVIDASTGSR